MNQQETQIQLRRVVTAIYVLCAITVTGLVVSIGAGFYLTKYSLAEMKALSGGSEEQLLVNEFNVLLNDRKLDLLEDRCHEEMLKHPFSPTPVYFLGLVHYQRGQKEESEKHLIKALELEPSWKFFIQPYLDKP